MPELTVYRNSSAPPPMVCMYCGAPATGTREWHEANRKPARGGGGGHDATPVPAGDDPASAVIGLLLLPFVLWDLLKALAAGVGFLARPRAAAAPPPPVSATTLVVVTTCDRHRRFRARFAWAGLATAVGLVGLWVWAILVTRRAMGTEAVGPAVTLMMTAVVATVLLPIAVSTWYVFGGPVIVERVTEGTVVLDRVRQAYFDATGRTPTDPAA